MSWYSILPAHLTVYETWAVRIFIFLGIINIAPWLGAFAFDFVLYIYRLICHLIPVYGGAARGENRPRAPSVRNRGLSLVEMVSGDADSDQQNEQTELRRRRDKYTQDSGYDEHEGTALRNASAD